MAVVLITGCSSGFGKLAAGELAAAGHQVIATMRDIHDRNREQKAELEKIANVRVLELDVTSDASVERAVELAESETPLDAVVHNAGIGAHGVAEGSTTEQFSYIMEVNMIGVHRLNRAVLPLLRARKSGLLIYMSSGLGKTSLPYFATYCASKHALEAYAESLGYELSTHGIDTVIIQPGSYLTGFRKKILYPDDPGRLADYAVEQAESEQLDRNTMEMLNSEMAPDPRDVTNAMIKVLSMSPGERPLRIALRKDAGGLKMINQICGEVQGAMLRGMNLEHRIPKRPQL